MLFANVKLEAVLKPRWFSRHRAISCFGWAPLLVCACGSDGTDDGRGGSEASSVPSAGQSDQGAAASLSDFAGRWDILIRFDWDDDADRTKYEFDVQSGAFVMRHCSLDDTCLAENWSCDSSEDAVGSVSEGHLFITWNVMEKRGKESCKRRNKAPQTGHGPKEQPNLRGVEQVVGLENTQDTTACSPCKGGSGFA